MPDENNAAIEKREDEIALTTTSPGTLALLSRAEIDTQIATAHAFPRKIALFQKKALDMLLLNVETAEECFYVLERKDKKSGQVKKIEGPSIRLAEIVMAAYGNMRAGRRVAGEDEDFITGQGICHDLENNTAITVEVQRRITNSSGYRYSADMIGVTANAASAIAVRNAIFFIVPKALWLPLYRKAREAARGEEKTLDVRRTALMTWAKSQGVSEELVCRKLGVPGVQDIGLDELVELRGIYNTIRDGEQSVVEAFEMEPDELKMPKRKEELQQTPIQVEPQAAQTAPAVATSVPSAPSVAPAHPPVDAGRFLNEAEVKELRTYAMNKGWVIADLYSTIRERFKADPPKQIPASLLPEITKILDTEPPRF